MNSALRGEDLSQKVPPLRVPQSPDEPTTLVEVFTSVARRHKRSDTLNYKQHGKWTSISSEQLISHARSIAAGLYSLGIKKGDRVAILSDSRVEWTLSDAGCVFAGVVDVPIYATLTPSQVQYILNDSGASALILANREKFLTLQSLLPQCPNLRHLIFFDPEGVTPAEGLTLAEVEARGRELQQQNPNISTQLEQLVTSADLATIIYTSGTTGEPKGVMLTHSNMVSNLIDSSGHLDFGEQDVALSVLPLSHVFERQAMYMYLNQGMAVYFAESLDTIAKNLQEVRPTVLVGVPRIFEKIYARVREKAAEGGRTRTLILDWSINVARQYAKQLVTHRQISLSLQLKHRVASSLVFARWRNAFGGRIRLLVSGGAALPDDLGYIYLGAGMPIIQGYGLTETSPVITAGQLEDNRIGTVGRVIPNVEIRLAADGEIETRGPHVMAGYYHKPEETRAVMTPDGWFKTGDIGSIDSDGFLRITDRKKELLKTSGGKYIAPQPIEQAIHKSRFVNQVVLIGNGRKFPAALIVPDWDQLASYTRLKGIAVSSRDELCIHPRIINLFERQVAGLTAELAQYEKIKGLALLQNEFTIEGGELTPTLKIKRRVIDEKYRAQIDKIYETAEASKPGR